MAEIAEHRGLAVVRGKMVIELAPPDMPGKGSVVLREVRARSLSACLYAGDDLADLLAFEALDELRAEGVGTAKVAVRGPETPAALIEASDVVVDGPPGLVGLLRGLLAEPGAAADQPPGLPAPRSASWRSPIAPEGCGGPPPEVPAPGAARSAAGMSSASPIASAVCSTSNALTGIANRPSSRNAPAVSDRIRGPSPRFRIGPSFATRFIPSSVEFTSSAS